jgi:hypothetical protein
MVQRIAESDLSCSLASNRMICDAARSGFEDDWPLRGLPARENAVFTISSFAFATN